MSNNVWECSSALRCRIRIHIINPKVVGTFYLNGDYAKRPSLTAIIQLLSGYMHADGAKSQDQQKQV